jgi:hypothetical protein
VADGLVALFPPKLKGFDDGAAVPPPRTLVVGLLLVGWPRLLNIEDVVFGNSPNMGPFGAASAAPLSDFGGGAAGVVEVAAPNPTKLTGGFCAGVVDAPLPKSPRVVEPPAAPKALVPEVFCAPVPLMLSGFFPNMNPAAGCAAPEPKTVPDEAPAVPNGDCVGGLEAAVAFAFAFAFVFAVPNGLLLPVAGCCDPNKLPPPLEDGGPKLKDMLYRWM